MFAENLRRARNKKKLTQQEIAQELGISQQAYAQWERGVSSPNPENLRRVAEASGVSVNYLTEESDEIDRLIETIINKTADGKMRWEIFEGFPIESSLSEDINAFVSLGKIEDIFKSSETIYISYMKESKYMFIVRESNNYALAFGFAQANEFTGPIGRVIKVESKDRDLSLLAKEIQRERTKFIEDMIEELEEL